MNRKETTDFLQQLLKNDRLSGIGKHWASEVSIDYGSTNVKRVDFMQFEPAGVTSISAIEKGVFTCFEVKSCKEDVYSGNGLNFLGEKNYIVTTMECYKDILDDYKSGKLDRHIKDSCPDSALNYGIMVAVPKYIKIADEFETPTKIHSNISGWRMAIVIPCRQHQRQRSITELLFCMLRSGH